jgi:hypothetical protein
MQATDSSKRVSYAGTGRRKTSIVRVRLVPGTGKLIIFLWLRLLWKPWAWKVSMTFLRMLMAVV